MRIGELAQIVGTTTHALRCDEHQGLAAGPDRGPSGYRDDTETDIERFRLLVGLRQLDLPLAQAVALSSLRAAGRCDEASAELREMIRTDRADLHARMIEMQAVDRRLAYIDGGLASGSSPRPLIVPGKEGNHADAL